MTAVKPAPAPTYVSGWCATGSHDRCRGGYAGVACQCACQHRPAEPEPEPEPEVHPATPAHSAGVASVGYAGKLAQAVCTCGWAAPEARRRNHDAFDDARQHLAETWQAVA